MIRCDINKKDRSINIKGHSGHAAIGYDIICASVSVLDEFMQEYSEIETRNQYFIEEKGNESTMIFGNENEDENIFYIISKMLKSISIEFPENLKVNEYE